MIHPKRDLAIALIMLIGGVAGLAGGLVGLFGGVMTFNFGAALRLQVGLLHGSTAIARWRVEPAVRRAWLDAESQRQGPRPEWWPGGRFLSIPSSGLQAMRAVALWPDSAPRRRWSAGGSRRQPPNGRMVRWASRQWSRRLPAQSACWRG